MGNLIRKNIEVWRDNFLSPKLWISIAVLLAAVAAITVLNRAVRKYLREAKLEGRKITNAQAGASLLRYGIYVCTLLIILQVYGIDMGAMMASLGLATAAVAFAVQDTLKDFISGANMMSNEFFSVGDVVKYKEIYGVVKSFNMKATKIYDVCTGNTFTVFNRNITEIERVSDWLDIQIPVNYREDVGQIRGICMKICERAKTIPAVKGCEFLGTDSFEHDFMYYRIRVHCPPELRVGMRRRILELVQDIFAQEKIAIPYPQMDVHLKQEEKEMV